MDRPPVPPALLDLLAAWRGVPALVRDEHLDVIASNPLAMAVSAGFTPGVNIVRYTFMNEWAEESTSNWAEVSAQVIAALREGLAGRSADDSFRQLVGELAVHSEQFSTGWADEGATAQAIGAITVDHPLVGPLQLTYQTLGVPGYPGLSLVIWTTEPGSTSERALDRLIQIVESQTN